MRVVRTRIARAEYEDIVLYLFEKFGIEFAMKFEESFKYKKEQLKKHPKSFGSFHETDKRKFLINPYITAIYGIDDANELIRIYSFWFNRKNPEDLLKYL